MTRNDKWQFRATLVLDVHHSAESRNCPPPMIKRETPSGPLIDCSADFIRPIQCYFHVLIDNYSRWLEVEVVSSTEFPNLCQTLDRSFGLLEIPLSITHDNESPYQSQTWEKYAKEMGFERKPCTPEHPEANSIAERFMSVIVKTIHVDIAEGKDLKVEVWRQVMNYCNTHTQAQKKTQTNWLWDDYSNQNTGQNLQRCSGTRQDDTRILKAAMWPQEIVNDKGNQTWRLSLSNSKRQSSNHSSIHGPTQVTKVKGTPVTAQRGPTKALKHGQMQTP